MSEYIEFITEVDLQPRIDEFVKRINRYVDEATLAKCERQLEEYGYVKVTSCRDCKHVYIEDGAIHRHWCDRKERGKQHSFVCHPDGFCAWGERREES